MDWAQELHFCDLNTQKGLSDSEEQPIVKIEAVVARPRACGIAADQLGIVKQQEGALAEVVDVIGNNPQLRQLAEWPPG